LTSVIAVNVPKLMKDESDLDMMVRCAARMTPFVVTLSTRGATKEGIVEVVKQDYKALLRQNAGALGLAAEEHRSA
jgi:DNA replicative helicase MCM subunit Mcm2 (Cdc46/Mcm family)